MWSSKFIAGLLAGVLVAVHLAADDALNEPPVEVPQKIIVLLDGRVVSGDVQDRPGGYLVENSIGQVVIPFTQVRLTAVDLPDAYDKLRDSMTQPTATAHVALGQWCFDNRLFDSARDEVTAALLLEPQRKEARELLKQIERVTSGPVEMTVPSAPTKTRDGFERSAAQAPAGLSPSVTQDFVRRVQPLLMNKCGNAHCHGPAGTNGFRLTPVRIGMSAYRSLTDQNLSAVLRMIDVEQPRASPLLVVPQGTHGGKGELWTGPRADDQLAELRAWVTRAALDQSQVVTASAEAASSDADGSSASSPSRRDSFLKEILAEERPDKFDPAVFNRLMHGRD